MERELTSVNVMGFHIAKQNSDPRRYKIPAKSYRGLIRSIQLKLYPINVYKTFNNKLYSASDKWTLKSVPDSLVFGTVRETGTSYENSQ